MFTHHARRITGDGFLLGAISDVQVAKVRSLVEGAGQPFTYLSFPEMPHAMHSADPARYAKVAAEWFRSIDN